MSKKVLQQIIKLIKLSKGCRGEFITLHFVDFCRIFEFFGFMDFWAILDFLSFESLLDLVDFVDFVTIFNFLSFEAILIFVGLWHI